MQRVTGLSEEQVLAYEAQAEAAMRAALQGVMDKIAKRIEASVPVLASALVAADEPGAPPPADGGLPPGQPYVSPDDLTSIPPLWQQAVQDQLVPIAAQVFLDAAMRTHASMVDASNISTLPSVGSLAAERYLAQVQNTFEEVGDDLWATARTQLLDGFEQGESIPELAARLRASADLTARRAVLVARTQVNEASNAGSFSVAQASGLRMQKEWIATPDLRTRPTHLAADGQRVDLADPFIVGGFSAMFPAAPTLPPAERYNCRCTIGYVMPDRAPAQVRADDLQAQQLADLPGTTSPIDDLAATQSARLQQIIDEQHTAVEQVIQDVHRRFGETFPKGSGPGFDLPARGENPPSYIRPSLREAKTPRQLRRVWQDEVESITGFPFVVDAMPRGISMVTAREYAEGTLQMFAQFPGAKVDRIHWFDDAASSAYAHVRRGGHAIEFNMRYASEAARPKFLAARRKDVAGWNDPTLGTSWSVRNDLGGQGVVYHEFTHILDIENGREVIHSQLVPLLIRHAEAEGVTDIEDLIKRRISSYAASARGSMQELVAEAGTDVMVNGAAASQLSRDIFDLVRAEYRRRGFEIRTAPAIDDLGEILPKPEAPGPGFMVRPALEAARTTGAVERAFNDEFERITGRRPQFSHFAGSAATAREHAEGLLRGMERFPDADLSAVSSVGVEAATTYAHAIGSRIAFNYEWTRPDRRKKYLDSLQRDVAGWEQGVQEWGVGIFRASSFHPRGTGSPIAVALHEFGHIIDVRTTAKAIRPQLDELLKLRTAQAIRRGRPAPETPIIDQEDLIFREISSYATKNHNELVAEAFADVMMNGGAASTLSREIFDLLEAEYRRRGGVVRAAPLIDEVLPSQAAPRALSVRSMTVTDLRAELTARGVAIPAKARKADLVREVEAARAKPGALDIAPIAPRALSTQTVTQLRALAKERGIVVPAGARKADLVKALEGVVVPLDEKAALRAAARERNRLIESSQGTARLLAEVDELIANKATKAAIRQRLDPALIAPEQVYAGADPAVVEALRLALDTGDTTKLRAALTRATTKAKLKGVSKAGAKAKYDPATMDGVGGIDIPAGAQVIVVRRGTTLTLPDGTTMQLTRAQVTPIAQAVQTTTRAPAAIQARQAQLRIDAARPTLPDRSRRQSGQNAYTTQVEHEGGPPTVTKDFSRLGEGPAASKRRADAEELGALVSESTGIRAPAVIRTGPRSVEMEFIEGKAGDEFLQWGQSASDVGLTGTDDGRLLGLADILMGNTDRNAGNFIRMTDGHLAAIDHETAFGPAKLAGAGDRFGADLVGREDFKDAKWPASIDINPADLVVIRERLEALAPEFDRLGRSAWHRQVMARLVEIEKRASASAPIRLPGLAPQPMTVREFDTAIKAASRGEKALDAAPVRRRVEHGRRTEIVWRGTDDAQVREAVESYTGYDFDPVNNALRGIAKVGLSGPGARLDQIIEGLDSALDRSRLTADVELWRGAGPGRSIFGDPDTWGDDLTGFTWRDDAYTSGTVDRDIAVRFLRAGPGQSTVMLHYVVPRGSRVLSLSDPDPYLAQAEGEMLLARGARFRVVRDNGWITIRNPRTGMDITRVRDLDVEVSVPDETPPLPWVTN